MRRRDWYYEPPDDPPYQPGVEVAKEGPPHHATDQP